MRDKLFVGVALMAIAVLPGCGHTKSDGGSAGLAQAENVSSKASAEQAEKERLDQAEKTRLAQLEKERLELAEKARQEQAEQERLAQAEKARIKASVESVLEQDSKTNQGVQSVAEVVARMREIDTSNCPNDFRSAYLDHIYAWEAMEGVERDAKAFQSEANSDGTLIESFIRGMLGDPLGKANEISNAQTQLQRRYQEANQEIHETFHKVEDTAILYGATLP